MEWLRTLVASWKVRVALVGGALVVATAYGTCTVEPAAVSDAAPTTNTENVQVSTSSDVQATTTAESPAATTPTETTEPTTTTTNE